MFEIKQIKPFDTYDLRLKVLSHDTFEDCMYKGDFEDNTLHIGAFKENEIIGVASFFCETHKELPPTKMYRLKGLAIDPKHRKQLRGQTLILFGENLLRQKETEIIWCTTKISNIQYYNHLGFFESDYVFNHPTKGLHILMYKNIER